MTIVGGLAAVAFSLLAANYSKALLFAVLVISSSLWLRPMTRRRPYARAMRIGLGVVSLFGAVLLVRAAIEPPEPPTLPFALSPVRCPQDPGCVEIALDVDQATSTRQFLELVYVRLESATVAQMVLPRLRVTDAQIAVPQPVGLGDDPWIRTIGPEVWQRRIPARPLDRYEALHDWARTGKIEDLRTHV